MAARGKSKKEQVETQDAEQSRPTHTEIEQEAPTSIADINLYPRGRVVPSPTDWRDQIIYQLLPDRFSDGEEESRPMFDPANPDACKAEDPLAWQAAGNRFVGGKIRGIIGKLDYLQGLGVTTIWLNPVWKQRAESESYHGYGIQNFLEVDPRLGTRQDLRDLVDAAHDRGMYVLLDVVFNHTGDNWFYADEESGEARSGMPYRQEPPYAFHGWRSAGGESIPEVQSLDDGVWPREFQNPDWYTRAGSIGNWDPFPGQDTRDVSAEFRRGDFFNLKDLNVERDDVLSSLARCYQYWIAVTDCDGFRIDAVKHMPVEASSDFCGAIREYAQSIGKDNFFLVGEVIGAQFGLDYLDVFGRNLDARLAITRYPGSLMAVAKSQADPSVMFDLYNKHDPAGFIRYLGRFIVTVLDDHDMSTRGKKARFAAHVPPEMAAAQLTQAVGMQLTMPGIPSIYYGTEQALDGSEDDRQEGTDAAADQFIRESMFGGEFGAFRTAGCHFFNPGHPAYRRIAAMAAVRNRATRSGAALRRGRFYPRPISPLGGEWMILPKGELMAWSRLFHDTEVLIVANTHALEDRGGRIAIDGTLYGEGSQMAYLYRSDWSDEMLADLPTDQTIPVQNDNGRFFAELTLPPGAIAFLTNHVVDE